MDKRKLIAILALGGSIAIGSLFMGGDEPIHGSYRGGYYSQAGSYRGGGAAAPVETVTIMFVMDTTFTTGHQLAEYDADFAAADIIYELGTEVSEFAYVALDSSHLGVCNWTTYVFNDRYIRGMITKGGADWALTSGNTYLTDPGFFLTYIDWTKYIPAGVTIVDAKLGVRTGTWYQGYADSVSSTLMDNANDNIWYTSRGVNSGYTDAGEFMSHASYAWQILGGDPGYTYPVAASSGYWIPALDQRDYFWDWGTYTQWSGADHGGGSWSGYFGIDIARCVQAAINGVTNNGIMHMFKDTGAAGSRAFYTFETRSTGGYDDYEPWFTVKYITKPYTSPLPNGKDFAFVFTAYDGNHLAYNQYAEAYAGREGKFTVYIMKRYKTNGAFTFETMKNWIDADIEVSLHDGFGEGANGFTGWHVDTVMTDTLSYLYQDSLRADISPEWMYEWSYEYDGDRREDEPLFGKGMGIPQGQWSPEVNRILCDSGFMGMSYHNLLHPNVTGVGDFWDKADSRPATTDTMRYPHFPSDGGRSKNMRVVSFTHAIQFIVGAKTNTTITEDEVRWNMKMEIQRTLAQGATVVAMFTHDLKSGGYAEGLDKEELEWLLLEVDANNGCTMTVLDFCAWIQQWATAVTNPMASGPSDTFKYFTAAERVIFVPDGMDGTFIRGLR